MASRVVAKRRITRVDAGGGARQRFDHLAAEEPLEIRVDGQTRTTTMRTPGEDFELALGWCLAEGVVEAGDVATIRYCAGPGAGGPSGTPTALSSPVDPGAVHSVLGMADHDRQSYNIVDVTTRSGTARGGARLVATTSACGLCGSDSIAEVRARAGEVRADGVRVPADVLAALPDRLRAAQAVFERTGGLHAAGVFTAAGDVVCVREDVGRHNAVDKVLGWAATAGTLPLEGHVLMVSGRVAFEIVAKALVARVPVVAAVSAPTSLAAELADEAGATLVGFLRGQTMNIYTHPDRVTSD